MPASLPATRDAPNPRGRTVTTILLIMLVVHDRQGHLRAPLGNSRLPLPRRRQCPRQIARGCAGPEKARKPRQSQIEVRNVPPSDFHRLAV